MPIYEFQCKACAGQFESLQRVSDPIPQVCALCGAEGQVSKKISAAGFRLKGGGWYETDFKGNKKKNVAAGEGDGTDAKADKGKDGDKSSAGGGDSAGAPAKESGAGTASSNDKGGGAAKAP